MTIHPLTAIRERAEKARNVATGFRFSSIGEWNQALIDSIRELLDTQERLIRALEQSIKDRNSYLRYPACDNHGVAEPDVITNHRITLHDDRLAAILEPKVNP